MDNYDELDFENADKLTRGRRTFRRRPKQAANVVAHLLARKGYGQQKSADQISETWNAIADEAWRDQTRVGVIKRGALEILVSNSGLKQRIEFDKKRLLIELQKHLPNNKIRDIRFLLGNV